MLNKLAIHFVQALDLEKKISFKIIRANLASLVMLLVAAGFLLLFFKTTSNDLQEYFIVIEMIRGTNFFVSFLAMRYEIGSLLLLWTLPQLFTNFTAVYLIGLLSLSLKHAIFKKYLNYPNLAFLIYVLTFAYIVDANQIRFALALCVVFYALFKEPTSKFSYLFLALFSTTFHYSGILILCFYFVKRPIILLSGVGILGLVFDLAISNFSYFQFATIWKSTTDGQVSLTSTLFFAQFFLCLACVIEWRFLSDGQKRGALLCIFGVTVYLLFLNNPIVAHRIRELSQIGIFAIIFLGEPRWSSIKIVSSLCLGYMVCYNLLHILLEIMSVADMRL